MIRLPQLDLESEKTAETYALLYWDCVVTENIHSSTKGGCLVCTPLPQEFPGSLHTFPLKIWLLRPPTPLRISDDLPWCGYRYFWTSTLTGLEKSAVHSCKISRFSFSTSKFLSHLPVRQGIRKVVCQLNHQKSELARVLISYLHRLVLHYTRDFRKGHFCHHTCNNKIHVY